MFTSGRIEAFETHVQAETAADRIIGDVKDLRAKAAEGGPRAEEPVLITAADAKERAGLVIASRIDSSIRQAIESGRYRTAVNVPMVAGIVLGLQDRGFTVESSDRGLEIGW